MGRRDKPTDPFPPGGLAERVYCTLYAIDGFWSPYFLEALRRLNGDSEIPERFVKRAAEIKRRRDHESLMRRAADDAAEGQEAGKS